MLDELNDTELWELARLQLTASWGKPMRLFRHLTRERVIHLVYTNEKPRDDEVILESRKKLQDWVAKNWERVNSQLPCSGKDRGKCTVYNCPEGRHLLCYSLSKKYML